MIAPWETEAPVVSNGHESVISLTFSDHAPPLDP